jgi:quinol monooxygenase YgiN
MATEIVADTPTLTLCNVFITTPETQQELIDILSKATTDVMSKRPGFISANLHASTDGLRVVNYAQWESNESFQGMLSDPVCRTHMAEAETLLAATPDVHIYQVSSTFGATDKVALA